jgi:hypothetical protein
MGGSPASMGMRKVLREAGVLHPRSQNRDLGHPAPGQVYYSGKLFKLFISL